MRIIFMGTPDFAVASLKALVDNHFEVVAVVTMPDKPAGRGHKLQSSPVKQYALDQGIPVLQPEKLKDEAFLSELKSYQADLQIVVAFRMLPEVVWNMPPRGTFNLHASLLPQYRGAAPINWAIINGDTETGVTTFFLTHEIDTGKIIMQRKVAILPEDNAGSLHDKLMNLGASVVIETVEKIQAGSADAIDQSEFLGESVALKAAPKIFKETCRLPLEKNVAEVHNFVRGMSPYPAAWIELQFTEEMEPQVYKIYETAPELCNHNFNSGALITDRKTYAKITLPDGYLQLLNIQPPGRKRMTIGEFLRGLRY